VISGVATRKKNGPIKVTLAYIDDSGGKKEKQIPNKFWPPADFLLSEIQVDTVDLITVQREVEKGKEHALPNWIVLGLTDKDAIIENGKEFSYYALFCRTSYYKQLAEKRASLLLLTKQKRARGYYSSTWNRDFDLGDFR
jgi:hypothetical protein